MNLFHRFQLLALFLIIPFLAARAQPVLQNNYSFSMEISSVIAMESSPAHLYVLSETEGLAVFRTHRDSLQWLYSSAGMQQRGSMLRADIRFAYLFGEGSRLTVLAPTSVMGAYSATTLPDRPLDTERIDQALYVAMGSGGLGWLNLATPQTLDSPIQAVTPEALNGQTILDIEASSSQLYALSAGQKLFIFQPAGGTLKLSKTVALPQNINHIYLLNHTLMGSNQNGALFEISPTGTLSKWGSIGEPVVDIIPWREWLIIKGSSSRMWTSYKKGAPVLWKKNGEAGNFIAQSKEQLWICEYGRISRIVETEAPAAAVDSTRGTSSFVEIEPIEDQTIPYPNPLLIPLHIDSDIPVNRVQLTFQSDIKDAVIRGQSFYWQPQSGDIGQHQVKIIASTQSGQTATTRFTVNVRPFNSPPRFIPLRPITIPVGHAYHLPIRAIDSDGMNKNLIRYLGVDLPKGASINEQTGTFSWNPTPRQVGKNTFRVIATDQYGAASSIDVTIKVIQTNLGQQ